MPDVYETDKDAVSPNNPVSDSNLVVGAATVKTGEVQMATELATKDTKEVTPEVSQQCAVVEEVIFDGVGGFVAVEDRKRGLIKAYAGDKIVRLDNGQGYVVPKEVLEATPLPLGTEVLTTTERDRKAEELRFKQERETRERAEKERQEKESRRLGETTDPKVKK